MKSISRRFYDSRQYSNLIQAIAVSLCFLTTPAIAQATPQPVSKSLSSSQAETSSRNCLDAFYAANNPAADSQPLLTSAIASCQQAIILTQAAGNQRLAAYSLGNLGSLYLQQQEQQQAISQFEQALAIARQIDDQILEVKALVALGTAHAQLQQFEPAVSFYQQALTVAEVTSDPNSISIALYNLGLMHDALGHYQQSVAAYERAEKTAEASGDVILAAYASQKLHLANQAIIQVRATP